MNSELFRFQKILLMIILLSLVVCRTYDTTKRHFPQRQHVLQWSLQYFLRVIRTRHEFWLDHKDKAFCPRMMPIIWQIKPSIHRSMEKTLQEKISERTECFWLRIEVFYGCNQKAKIF